MDSSAQWDQETVDEALDRLGELSLWDLAPQRWAQIEYILDELAAAYAAGDAEQFRHLLADLDLNGPTRVMRIGSLETGGITDPVLDRCNMLVHTLTGTPLPAGRPAEPESPKGGPGVRSAE